MKFLIVDDRPSALEVLEMVLKRAFEDCQVSSCESVESVVEILKEEKFNRIITFFDMLEEKCLKVIDAAVASGVSPKTIFLTTSYSKTPEQVRQQFEQRTNIKIGGFIDFPFKSEQIKSLSSIA